MKLAFVFPGQGSQSVGMMQGFDALPVVRKTFEEAGDILKLDLWQMVTSGPVEVINQTINTQPVMLTAGVAVYRAWQEMGGSQPAIHGRPQPGRIYRAGGRWRIVVCRCAAAGALSR